MSQPDFQAMNRKELLSYFFEHRDDQDAFYALMDKLATEPALATMPPSNGRDETEELRKILDDIRKKRQQEE
ncbi:MAG: hypothetical protein KME42_10535 [Tildeniella nuda ZEHNDER 1965/U140]|jgi:hypothetical protein|nr:hypothetical protein [Tildeniella nuda ZEHNDER 1965/U140]